MSYIDELAIAIHREADPDEPSPPSLKYLSLYRIYAVLMLAKGEATTNKDVHDAWSAWTSEMDAEHRSLIPFDALSPAVQELDTPYTKAIHTVYRQVSAREGGLP